MNSRCILLKQRYCLQYQKLNRCYNKCTVLQTNNDKWPEFATGNSLIGTVSHLELWLKTSKKNSIQRHRTLSTLLAIKCMKKITDTQWMRFLKCCNRKPRGSMNEQEIGKHWNHTTKHEPFPWSPLRTRLANVWWSKLMYSRAQAETWWGGWQRTINYNNTHRMQIALAPAKRVELKIIKTATCCCCCTTLHTETIPQRSLWITY